MNKSVAVLVLFFLALEAFTQQENINTPENFPDSRFRTAVEEILGVGSGEAFTADQASQLRSMRIDARGIRDLTGIQFFAVGTGLRPALLIF